MFGSIPFIPGSLPKKPEPLSGYLPLVPDGVTSSWLKINVPQGSWILEPFGASPHIALEVAHAGYRVLVTANNPINRFMLEMMADPPKTEELKAALAELSASYVGSERTEPHIRSLYNTYCNRCGQIVSAVSFIWEHGNPTPYMRIYSCPSCGDSGEYPCTAYDAELSSKFSSSGLHKARALERVVASNDQDRIHVEQALSVYIPRALYALITIINKIEGLNISPAGQKYLNALLLYAFDQANAMWRFPSQKERRRQLTIPRHFREKNIWYALEEGINIWSKDKTASFTTAIPVTIWPEIPPISGGICVYEGRFINLADSIKEINIKSVCTAIPRPNQAFWTLSALWAGWLWGREAVGRFKSVLRRQRYDWAWHTNALASVYKQLTNNLEPDITIFGLINEAEPGFIGAALVAAGVAGCHLESIALRPEENQAQIIWKCEKNPEITQIGSSLSRVAIQSAKSYLEKRAEPASYLSTIAAAFMGIVKTWNPKIEQHSDENNITSDTTPEITRSSEQIEPTPSLIYTSTYNSGREALSYRSGFLRYNLQDVTNVEGANKNQLVQSSLFDLDLSIRTVGDNETENPELSSLESVLESEKERPTRSSDISESTFLWLRDTDEVNHSPITDSYELNLVNYLFSHPGCTIQDVDLAMCELFTGLFTPDYDFIQLCLESYSAPDPHDPDRWYVRPEDNLSERKLDIEHAKRFIHQIGDQLGFICNDHIDNKARPYITWWDKNGDLDYRFFPMISAAIGEIVLFSEQPPMKGFIVLPGSRANLLVYKLRRDPRISKAFNPSLGYWRFLKFRHLRSLTESPILNRENLDQLLGLDPITYSTSQILLL
jgi:hypothetical protein